MVFFVLLVGVVLGAVGLLVKGLLWLFFIGLVLAVASFVFGGLRLGRKTKRP